MLERCKAFWTVDSPKRSAKMGNLVLMRISTTDNIPLCDKRDREL